MFAHSNPHSSDFGDICALYSPFLHQLAVQSSLFEPGHLRPCPSYSRRRDCVNLGLLRSLYKWGINSGKRLVLSIIPSTTLFGSLRFTSHACSFPAIFQCQAPELLLHGAFANVIGFLLHTRWWSVQRRFVFGGPEWIRQSRHWPNIGQWYCTGCGNLRGRYKPLSI